MIEVRKPQVICKPLSKFETIHTWVKSRKQFLKEVGPFVWDRTSKKLITKSKYADKLTEMDLAYEYFDVCVFNMRTSVLVREFFYTFNEYKAKWATTQRYATQKNFILSKECYNINPQAQDAALNTFIEQTEAFNRGEIKKFDGVREHMPLSFQVNYQFCMSKKQFVKCLSVIAYLIGVNHPLFKELYEAAYQNVCLREKLNQIHKYFGIIDEDTKYEFDENHECAEMLCGMVLYSQLIRHECVTCKGYWNFFRHFCNNEVKEHSCKVEFPLNVDMTTERRNEIVRVRTSWFAVTDDWESNNTWACFLRRYIKEKEPQIENYKWMFAWFDEDGNYKPNFGVHGIDDNLRLHKGYNAYFPNAFILESRKLVEQRIEREGMNPLLFMYLQMFDKGYIIDNPNNKLRKKWEELNEGN